MPTRNTPVLKQIIEVLGDSASPDALAKLENHFKDSLMVVAGDIQTVAALAETLRLAVNTAECGLVLDHLAPQVRLTIDHVEDAVNTLFDDRFIEP